MRRPLPSRRASGTRAPRFGTMIAKMRANMASVTSSSISVKPCSRGRGCRASLTWTVRSRFLLLLARDVVIGPLAAVGAVGDHLPVDGAVAGDQLVGVAPRVERQLFELAAAALVLRHKHLERLGQLA